MKASWLFNRRVWRTLLRTAALFAAAVVINIVGIKLLGSLESWQRWLSESSLYFFVWRLLIYSVTAGLWLRMRHRLLARETGTQARKRLIRAEIVGCLTLVLLETSLFVSA
ncbi:TPA: hypothetical protein ACP31N_002295 [Pseudomonas aeruginosa]|uniref:hypothetical protein n=1 Tax=Pseudomonas aeruginosa TaxID=287 RepID=UPI0022EC0EA2|nr:hypothetical protein [Pseudomonas aeruginosa]HBP0405267.1 hypothetical protein [Pseudomonas aeruginosa]HCE3929157.1 hypothetical protein [Pseudomonas aeruginosa]HCE3931619.1 hypothetical protein [Pseudomonas aeruginosa]